MIDPNAIPSTSLSVAITHNHADVERTPFNIASAINSLFEEYVDLMGDEDAKEMLAKLSLSV